MEKKLVEIYAAEGILSGEIMQMFLQSMGIDATAVQESAGVTLGLTVSELGEAKVYVPEDQVEQAKEILEGLKRGDYELPEDLSAESDEGELDSTDS